MAKRNNPEQDLQIEMIDWLDLALNPYDGWRWHTPNEGQQGGVKGKVIGQIRKNMGLMPGFPDLCITHSSLICAECGAARIIGVEVKVKSPQTQNQKACQARFEQYGWPYYIARSIDDLREMLKKENVPVRVREFDFGGDK